MRVEAIGSSSSVSPSTVYGPVKRLQPVEPETLPSSKLALGATSSHPSTSIPAASTHGTPSSDEASTPPPSSPPQPTTRAATTARPSGATASLTPRR